MTKAYFFMFIAIFCEVAGTLLLPSTQNFTKIIPIIITKSPKTVCQFKACLKNMYPNIAIEKIPRPLHVA